MNGEAQTILDMDNSRRRWLDKTKLLNLDDDRLRLKAMSLVQLATSERERLLVIYEFVKSMPLSGPSAEGYRSARQVLDAKTGDAFSKSTLMVAMLRLVGIPTRMRFLQLHGDVVRGLTQGMTAITHPVVECWLDGRWLKTDTHVYDIHYLVTAREKLNEAGWTVGYGIHRYAHSIWDGLENAYAGFAPGKPQGLPLRDFGVFDDPGRFERAMRVGSGPVGWFTHKWCDFRWALNARTIRRGMRKLRDEITLSVAKPSSEPVRITS